MTRLSETPAARSLSLDPAKGLRALGSVLLLAALLALLAGCADRVPLETNYQAAKRTTPRGSDFNRHLHADYLKLAEAERGEYDWGDGNRFALKALAAAEDQQVAPDAFYERRLPVTAEPEMKMARRELTDALEAGGRKRAPREAAAAQTSFDCWMQEQEEDHQSADIDACRDRFYASIGEVQRRLGLPVLAAPAKLGETFVVFFEIGSDKLTEQSVATVRGAAAAKSALMASKILVSGHADKLGDPEANLELSKRRAEAVRQLLLSAGIKAEDVSTAEYGENRPRVATSDDEARRENRRVEINLLR